MVTCCAKDYVQLVKNFVLCSSMDRTLPFELRALEAALAHTCRSLEQESIQVERATLPSLKALMQKVNPQHPNTPPCLSKDT